MEDVPEKNPKAPVRVWLLKGNQDPSDDMLAAFELCEQYRSNGIIAEWMSHVDCMKRKVITKKDVFVLETFSGRVFEKLSATTAIIVGPKCLLCCINTGEEIPKGSTFTIAMRDIVVTISRFPATDKEKLHKYISWMGGRYENQLTGQTTHLISKSVFSEKYVKAASLGIPIMKSEWIEAAWKESQKKNISAMNPLFDKYKLPIFYGVCATTTGIKNKRQRKIITDHITKNGGEFYIDFQSSIVNVLILNSEGMGSKKHEVAVECGILCVSPDWIYKSIEIGYALDPQNFIIESSHTKNPTTSSPQRTSQLPDMSINVSCIPNMKNANFNDDTCSTTNNATSMSIITQGSQMLKNTQLNKVAKEYAQLIDSIDMSSVKKAGPFLDGCCIYVYGASPSRREKLQRIVSLAGGVRFDDPDESISHTICCDPSSKLTLEQLSAMPGACHVTVAWLFECIKLHRAVDESQYSISNNDNTSKMGTIKNKLTKPSPMSKVNLQLLQGSSVRPPVPPFNLDPIEVDKDEIVQQYLSQNDTIVAELENPKQPTVTEIAGNHQISKRNVTLKNIRNKEDEVQESNISEKISPVFEGLSFELCDIDEEAEQIVEQITNAGGTIVKRRKRNFQHYIVVPLNYEIDTTDSNAEVITTAWLDECLLINDIVPINYYHRPIKSIPKTQPLSGLVISLSKYMGSERAFLYEIATLLGAKVHQVLHKQMTHLVCAEASGEKYKGAINWGITVVTNQWLLDCLDAEKYIREKSYLVGSSKEPEHDDTITTNEDIESKEPLSNKSMHSSYIENKDENNSHIANNVTQNEIEYVEPEKIIMENKRLSQIKKIPSEDSPLKNPLTKLSSGSTEMSPASRYIDMNRRGMITNSQSTPKVSDAGMKIVSQQSDMCTPPIDNVLSTPNLALFSTTSKRRILAVKRGEMPSNPLRTPKNPFETSISTPESPFGAFLRPESGRMSPESRKKLKRFCDGLPSPVPKPQTKQEISTPDLLNNFFSKHSRDSSTPKLYNNNSGNIESDVPPAKQIKLSKETSFSKNHKLQDQLRRIDQILTSDEGNNVSSPRSSRRGSTMSNMSDINFYMENMDTRGKSHYAESQCDTVGWDDMTETVKVHCFMLAQNVNNSAEVKCIIERLGGTVLEGSEFDLGASYFLCTSLTRSEKLLTCLAARKWVLHPDYIVESQKTGRFVEEELYEWGNPKAKFDCDSITESQKQLAKAACRLRKTPASSPLPFHSFKVILHMKESRKSPIARILKAGGGEVLDISPPYSGKIDATHCFVETQHKPLSKVDIEYFAKCYIPVCPPIFLNIYLVNNPTPNVMDYLCPEYKCLIN